MAVQGINPRRQVVQKGRKAKKGGSGLGAAIGAVAGGVGGAIIAGPGGAMAGASAGAALGGTVGGLAGQAIDPARSGRQQIERFSAQAPLTASEEAMRGQKLLEGLQIAQNSQGLAEYTAPLTKAYVQSMINLKRM
jgi:uncharacterized protein YcfJ